MKENPLMKEAYDSLNSERKNLCNKIVSVLAAGHLLDKTKDGIIVCCKSTALSFSEWVSDDDVKMIENAGFGKQLEYIMLKIVETSMHISQTIQGEDITNDDRIQMCLEGCEDKQYYIDMMKEFDKDIIDYAKKQKTLYN